MMEMQVGKGLKERSFLVIPISLLVVSKFLTWVAFPEATLHPDSSSYRNGIFLNFELVSLLGDSGRPWPVTLFYALLPNDSIRILAQLALSAFVWSYLILTLSHIKLQVAYKILVGLFLSLIGSSPMVTQWDTTILATSLLVSTAILITALMIRMFFTEKFTIWNTIILLILVLMLFIQKLSNAPIVAFFLIVILAFSFKWAPKKLKFALVAFSLFIFSWGTIVGLNINNSWEKSYSGTTLLWQLGSQSPAAIDFKQYLEDHSEAPKCIYSDAPFKDLNVSIARISDSCTESGSYMKNSFQRDFLGFIVSSPKSAIKLISIGIGASFTSASSHYGRSVSLFPSAATSIISGDIAPDLRFSGAQTQEEAYSELESGEPQWLHLPLLGILLIALVLLLMAKAQPRKEIIGSLVFIFANVFQLLVNYIVLPSEWVRQGAPFVTSLMAFSIVILVLQLFGNHERRFLADSR
jgi:hypothetical protein